ncbi:MAG: haloacid dehalogenase-like hydrolase [Spirochaetia bacterium]|nr:haloacid dehalogenase-like hydrolase [Spirochaetia bacterium]
MNVYDFDETLFTGDSEQRFFNFIFAKKGFFLYKINWHFWDMLLRMKAVTKTVAREHEYSFLKKIDRDGNLEHLLEEYWDQVEKYMKKWYASRKRSDDVIASGTPAFLMEPICRRLNVRGLVATPMDKRTGKIDGMFAIGEYKLQNYRKHYGDTPIDEFYSDTWSDRFLADQAARAYVIHDGEEISEWNSWFEAHPDKKGIQSF